MPEKFATFVHYVRYEKVILDSDLAEFFGVTTGRLNEGVQHNLEQFPSDFISCLSESEMAAIGGQTGTSNADPNALKSHIALAKNVASLNRDGRHTLPYAFTEQSGAMLLHSDRFV